MYLALGSLGTPMHLGGADVGEASPDQRAHFFCYHFDTFAGLVIWKVLLLMIAGYTHVCPLHSMLPKAWGPIRTSSLVTASGSSLDGVWDYPADIRV